MDIGTSAISQSLSRRSFIKAGAATAAALGLSGLSGCAAISESPAEAGVEEKLAYTYHPMNCGNRCSLQCTVRDGRLARIQGNTWTGQEEKFSICCFKGMSEIQHVYSPDRLQTPLKRVGERGSGEFQAISWDEALQEIADAVKKTQEENGKESLLFTYSSSIEYPMPLFQVLTGAQVAHESGIDMGLGNGSDPTFGDAIVGIAAKEIYDWVDSKTIVLVGVNPMETGLTEAQFLLDAKEAGAKLIVVDPMHTATAAKADQWIPIRPGNDTALYLGLATAIIDNGWYDEDFMREHTGAPFLVDVKTGALLRAHEPGEDGVDDGVLVYDAADKSVKPFGEAKKPALEGEFTHEGTKCKTVFTLLKEKQAEYTLEWASGLTGIAPEVLEQLAHDYATGGPAFLGLGFGGADKMANSDVTGHAASLLPSLTGNIGKPGTGIGVLYSILVSYGSPALGGWSLPEEFAPSPLEMQSPLFSKNPNSVRACICMGNALVQHFGNWGSTREWLKTLDFVACIDQYHSDTADWADIVLPATTCFEMRDECGNIQVNKNHVLIQQKVIEPLFDAKTDFEIEHELCELLGYGEYLPESASQVAKMTLDVDDPQMKGITYDALMSGNGLMRLDVPNEPLDLHAGNTFGTATGRAQFYHENMVKHDQALPTYERPLEVYADNPLREKYPLHMFCTRRKYYVHSTFQNSTWIGQIIGAGLVRLNPKDAEERGLKDGDTVTVSNDRGQVTATLCVDNSLYPGCVATSDGSWSRDTGGENFEVLVNDTLNERGADLMYGAAIPYNDTLVQVAKA